jgi:hypothetical protein
LNIDRRKHARIGVEKAIYIELVRPGFRRESENPILRCETVDVSVGGLLLRVPQSIPSGCTLNIAAPLGDWTEEVRLVGQAKWSKPVENSDDYWVGLELHDTTREDMVKWHEVIQRLEFHQLSLQQQARQQGSVTAEAGGTEP